MRDYTLAHAVVDQTGRWLWRSVSRSPTAGQAGDLSGAWIDRDISWLEFNRRVLHEALDERTPLLERVKFLAIFSRTSTSSS